MFAKIWIHIKIRSLITNWLITPWPKNWNYKYRTTIAKPLRIKILLKQSLNNLLLYFANTCNVWRKTAIFIIPIKLRDKSGECRYTCACIRANSGTRCEDDLVTSRRHRKADTISDLRSWIAVSGRLAKRARTCWIAWKQRVRRQRWREWQGKWRGHRVVIRVDRDLSQSFQLADRISFDRGTWSFPWWKSAQLYIQVKCNRR